MIIEYALQVTGRDACIKVIDASSGSDTQDGCCQLYGPSGCLTPSPICYAPMPFAKSSPDRMCQMVSDAQ